MNTEYLVHQGMRLTNMENKKKTAVFRHYKYLSYDSSVIAHEQAEKELMEQLLKTGYMVMTPLDHIKHPDNNFIYTIKATVAFVGKRFVLNHPTCERPKFEDIKLKMI